MTSTREMGLTGTQAKVTPSLRCNNDCIFCYNRNQKDQSKTLEQAQVMALIDEAVEAGRDELNLIGGEVTILPYFLEVLRYAGENFNQVSINTNGRRFCDMVFARSCAEAGLTNVDVSLHGSTAEIHDRVSGIPGAFEQTVTGLRNLRALSTEPDFPRLQISITTLVLDWSYNALPAMTSFVADLGIPSWRLKYAYGALGPRSHFSDSSYMARYSDAMPFLRKTLNAAEHLCKDLPRPNLIFHDIPICIADELLDFTTVFERHNVALYGKTDTDQDAAIRVVDRWGTTSNKCRSCAANAQCCNLSPAYVQQFDDAEITQLSELEYTALQERARAFRIDLDGRCNQGRTEHHRPQQGLGEPETEAAFARIDQAARQRNWSEVRCAAVDALERAPEHPEALRMKRMAEFHLLDEEAGLLTRAGELRRARKMRRFMEKHYQDVSRSE